MSLRINGSIATLAAFEKHRIHNATVQTSIDRLSSGLRVRGGADDAAGLTISERIRSQMRGLNQAISNMQSGVSLLQTAEGAMAETASNLNRLRELSIQSMDDALTTEDRVEIQKEADQLLEEIDRVANSTEFNTKKLLDGSSAAIITTTNSGTDGYATGGLGFSESGTYGINVTLNQAGDSNIMRSAIMVNRSTGNAAGRSTELRDIESFYDSAGNFVLESDQELQLRLNGHSASVIVNQYHTLGELADLMADAIRNPVATGGLGQSNSSLTYTDTEGQFQFTGTNGGEGNGIGFVGSAEILNALQMETVEVGTEDSFRVRMFNDSNVSDTIVAGTAAKQMLSGINLDFQSVEQAQIISNITQSQVVRIESLTTFQLSDTNTHANVNINASRRSLVDNITINPGTYSLQSLATRINQQINTGAVATRLGIQAVVENERLELVVSNETGVTSEIRIANGTGDTAKLFGANNLTVTGTGGTQSKYTSGGPVMKNGFTTTNARRDVRIRVNQMTDREVPNTVYVGPSYAIGTFLTGDQILKDHQDLIASSGLPLEVFWDDNGRLAFKHTSFGTDTGFRILRNGNAFITNTNPTGAGNGYAVKGSGGSEARLALDPGAYDSGFAFDGALNFAVTGTGGVESEIIRIYAQSGQVANSSSPFALTSNQLVSIFDAASLDQADATYRFNSEGRLEILSLSGGKYSKLGFVAKDTNTASTTARILTGLGININETAQGQGDNDITAHVVNRRLNFQIGANQGQSISFAIRNLSTSSLGITELDLTQTATATEALTRIDRASRAVSSTRSAIGSLINRLGHAQNSGHNYHVNLASAESKIRDVDIALETVAQTKSSILMQSGMDAISMYQVARSAALRALLE